MKNSTGPYPCPPPPIDPIIEEISRLRQNILTDEKQSGKCVDKIYDDNLRSARNLLHYLAFRSHDLRELQLKLSDWGLSSLGNSERMVQATLDMVLRVLHELKGEKWTPEEAPPLCFAEGRKTLEDNTEKLFGQSTDGRRVRIMVTMPTEAAENYDLVKNLMASGMNCARVNCAHDDTNVWANIIANVRKAEEHLDRKCKIHMDLGGPKLRTGPLPPLPAALKVRPKRNTIGEVVKPSQIWFFPEGKKCEPPTDADATLPVSRDWLKQLTKGDRIEMTDARGSIRRLKVARVSKQGCMVTCRKTIYFKSGLTLEINRKKGEVKKKKVRLILDLPPAPNGLSLKTGNQLLLTRSLSPGKPAKFDEEGHLLRPPSIGCTLPEVFEDAKTGEPIWFDDGKFGGIIEKVEPEILTIRITHTPPGGGILRSEKGINLPESELRLSALTEEDKENLKFVVKNADLVGLSFANRPEDVEELNALMRQIKTLENLSSEIPAVILKIETQLGFKNLPAMLFSAMQAKNCGVMIARGDLAIELGFGRLSEVQEQVLWICEAAHIPVVWATQVLEGLAKKGLPTRAEVTDAAMGQRAECIMLNKGPHIVEATRALGDILSRMQDHQTKKRATMRRLHLAERFFEKQV